MLKNQWNKIRSAIVSVFDRLLIWAIEWRGYGVVYPEAFRIAVQEINKTGQFVNKSGALTTARGKTPKAKKKILSYLSRTLLYFQASVNVRP